MCVGQGFIITSGLSRVYVEDETHRCASSRDAWETIHSNCAIDTKSLFCSRNWRWLCPWNRSIDWNRYGTGAGVSVSK